METAVGLAWFLGIYNDILQTCSCNYIGDHACHTCIAVLINGHAYAQGEKEKGAVLVDVIAGGHCIRRRQSCHFRVQTALRVAHLHCQPSDACPATPRAAEADSASTDSGHAEGGRQGVVAVGGWAVAFTMLGGKKKSNFRQKEKLLLQQLLGDLQRWQPLDQTSGPAAASALSSRPTVNGLISIGNLWGKNLRPVSTQFHPPAGLRNSFSGRGHPSVHSIHRPRPSPTDQLAFPLTCRGHLLVILCGSRRSNNASPLPRAGRCVVDTVRAVSSAHVHRQFAIGRTET
jgi:hypothetical protein